MIGGGQLRLRPVEERDFPDIQRWQNDADNWWWDDRERPLSLEDVKDNEAKARMEGHPFVVEAGSDTVGRIALTDLRQRDRRAVLDVLVGDPADWDEGYGAEAIRLLLDYAFAQLSLHMVELVCLSENERVLTAAAAVGFVREATLRQRSWKDGRWFDRAVLSITREEFEAAP